MLMITGQERLSDAWKAEMSGELPSRRRNRAASRASEATLAAPASGPLTVVDQNAGVPTSEPPTQPEPPASGSARSAAESQPVKRSLISGADVLPELTEAPEKPRPVWKHPAFIVSVIVAFLAILAVAAFIVFGIFFGGKPVVSKLSIGGAGGSVHLNWSGPDVPYSVFVVDGSGTPTDVTQLVTGRDIWIPNALGLYDENSCFVVRPSEVPDAVKLSADVLEAQGAQSVCMSDVGS